MEQFDILTLDNGKASVINKMLEYKGKEYLLLVEVDEEENILNEKLIAEKLKTEDGYSLSILDNNESIYKTVSEMFAKMLIQDLA